MAGAEIYSMPLLAENDFLPDLSAIPATVAKRARVMWLNYPNNPTGAIAPLSFFQDVVEFARMHDLIVAHDTPYADVCFEGYVAPSLLQIPGSLDVAVEFNSLSKAYNMAGWRLGMAVGQKEVVRYIGVYKSQKDTSHFEPILSAGIAALTGDQGWLVARNAEYQQRRDIVLTGLRTAGLRPLTPKAALYIWCPTPENEDDHGFCNAVLEQAGVSTTPGSVFGEHGRGYFRISLCTHGAALAEAVQRIAEWMTREGRDGRQAA